MKIVGFAIIGCGFIGRLHAKIINSIPAAKLLAVMDSSKEAAEALAHVYGCAAYDKIDDLLSNSTIDAVAICLPSGLHAPFTIAAANAGKHVICEKPIDIRIPLAQEMVAACEKNHVRFGVIMQHRFDEPILLLQKAIKEGLLGRLIWGASRTIWYRDDLYYSNPWRGTWQYDGGGALLNQSIHYIDLLLCIMGTPKSVSAKCRTIGHPQIETEDVGIANVEFRNGTLGTIEGTTAAYPGLYAELSIFGEKGTVIIRNDHLCFYQFMSGDVPEFKALLNPAKSSELNLSPDIDGVSHKRQYEDFISAIKEGRNPAVTGEDALKSLQLICAIYQSSDEKKEIFL